MKKVIDGKVYNTATAEEIGSDGSGNFSDFRFWEETLYRTKKGSYFMHGTGGPMSKYAISVGNNSTGGSSEISVLTEEEAFDWASEHLTGDEVCAAFPDRVEEA